MNEGDQWEGEVVTFMAPNKTGWLSKMVYSTHTFPWLVDVCVRVVDRVGVCVRVCVMMVRTTRG